MRHRFSSLLGSVLFSLAAACTHAPETDAAKERVDSVSQPVVGGRPAEVGEVLATVAILREGMPECTGALIADTLVLTAAHCVLRPVVDVPGEYFEPLDPAMLQVVAGPRIASDPKSLLHAIDVKAVHSEDFDALFEPDAGPENDEGLGRPNDVALLVLDRPVTTLAPVPLLPRDDVADLDEGRLLILSGYGIAGNVEGSIKGQLYVASGAYHRNNGFELHIGGDGVDACPGDSGGPAYLQRGSWLHIVGIASRGVEYEMGSCGAGSIYTIASAYESFIEAHAGGAYPPGGRDVPPEESCAVAASGPGLPVGAARFPWWLALAAATGLLRACPWRDASARVRSNPRLPRPRSHRRRRESARTPE